MTTEITSRSISITNCARCGGEHTVVVHDFQKPIAPAELAPFEWTQWAICPTTYDPILIGTGFATSEPEVLERHAENAYAAYGRSTGGKNFRGDPMPTWEALPEPIRTAWRESVRAVLR